MALEKNSVICAARNGAWWNGFRRRVPVANARLTHEAKRERSVLHFRPHRLSVRTGDSQSSKPGSIPGGGASLMGEEFKETLARNPTARMAHNNLGNLLREDGGARRCMARKLRLEYAGIRYHVLNRCNYSRFTTRPPCDPPMSGCRDSRVRKLRRELEFRRQRRILVRS
jgi:hypothetical protein